MSREAGLVVAGRASELLDAIIAVVGVDGYCALAMAFGGGKFYVPRWPAGGLADDHPITLALGRTRAQAFCRHFAGSDIVLPLGPWRRRAVLDLHASGLTGDQIARQLRISRSWVYEVLSQARRAPLPDLFGPDLFS